MSSLQHSSPVYGLSRRQKLLVAEDDDDVRFALHALLDLEGYEVEAVADGVALVDRVGRCLLPSQRADRPDCIITDLRMPGFGVLGTLAGLRDEGWDTPFLVVSAFADDTVAAHVADLGNARLFHKPIDFDALDAALATALETGKL